MRKSGIYNFPPMDRVVYGKTCSDAVRGEAERLEANRVFLMVSGTLNRTTDEIERVRLALGTRYGGTYDKVPQHTTRREVAEATAAALDAKADLIVAIGGGSVVDAAKIVLMCMEHGIVDIDGLDGFEVVPGPDGRPRAGPFRAPRVRMVAVPSTLSGGEYNAGCLVTDPRRKFKQTFFHPMMMPRAIILDPELSRHTPETLWLGSGTRAMDHGLEAICSPMGNPLVDGVVLRGLRLMRENLPRSKADPHDLEARRQCQYASWLCSHGLQARVPMGASHAIGHVLGGTCDVPHYLCTPVMMPSILRYNLPVTGEAQALIAEALGKAGEPAADAFAAFTRELGLPQRLADVGVGPDQFDLIGRNTMHEFFAFSNPRPLRTPEAVKEILMLAA